MAETWIPVVAVSFAAVSLTGSAYVILLALGARLSVQKRRLVGLLLAVSVTDCLVAITWLLDPADPGCLGVGFLKILFTLAGYSWSALITLSILEAVWQPAPLKRFLGSPLALNVVAWGVPAVLASGAAAGGSIGPDLYWCWLRADRPAARIAVFDVPAGLVVATGFVSYAAAARRVRRGTVSEPSDEQRHKHLVFHLRLNGFLLTQALCWLWAPLADVADAYAPAASIPIRAFGAMFAPSLGIFNAIFVGAGTARQLDGEDGGGDGAANV